MENIQSLTYDEMVAINGGGIIKKFGAWCKSISCIFTCAEGGSQNYDGQADYVHNSGGLKY
jgi:hypothetical protein